MLRQCQMFLVMRLICIGIILMGLLIAEQAWSVTLPYDRTNPVIYDNDGAIESGYTDVYIMALASAGIINLKGIITTCSYGEEQRQPPFSALPEVAVVRERQELIEKARRSGLRNIPDAIPGPSLSFKRPSSGRIEDTMPYKTPGSQLIVNEARRATSDKPLVIVMGGQATCVVDAYLMDNSIAYKMILAWIVGNKRSDGNIDSREYNAGVDPWATYIAFERLRVVAFPFTNDGDDSNDPMASTPKSRLVELPDTELRQIMMEARWPRGKDIFSEPSTDADSFGAFPLTRSDYVFQTKRVSFSHWEQNQTPFFKADPNGKVLVVWDASSSVATDEWWRRVKDPAAWGVPKGQIPFNDTPWMVPGSIEAEYFDHGGTGRAYMDNTNNLTKEDWFNPIRFLEHVDILASDSASNGYKVGRTEAGEWIEYTVNVANAGIYTVEACVASDGDRGAFHIEFDGADKTGSMNIPNTKGWNSWQTIQRSNVALNAGVQVMRLVMDRNGSTGAIGDFDYIKLRNTGVTDN